MPAAFRGSTIEPDVLDAYIIEEIKKQDEERRRREEARRPRLHIEIPYAEDEEEAPPEKEEDTPTEGAIIHIDL